jgi:Nucleotide modification associated domain 2
MTTLFTYCIPYDDGAAPNPYWGLCTLAICKPQIRRTAKVGDWIAGTGSKNSPIGDKRGSLVYAMKVTRKMTMQDYDAFTKHSLDMKIPDWKNTDRRRKVGDSIYDFSTAPPTQRRGNHKIENRETDLSGQFVLLSDYFFYFGDKPVRLPDRLLPIVKEGVGHRSISNAPYLSEFVMWIDGLGYQPNTLLGEPQGALLHSHQSREADEESACSQPHTHQNVGRLKPQCR